MVVDEFYFHQKRGLPIWEKIGHPLDSLSVIICYVYVILNPYSQQNLWVYIGLCAFSSIFVTKDEFIHAKICQGEENWLHALLFVIHPVSFLSAALLWMGKDIQFLKFQAGIIFIFLLYQIIYWSFRGKTAGQQRNL